ncbi:MAG: fatty acid CoA ligase family protein [Candidatus Binatia bacterium]
MPDSSEPFNIASRLRAIAEKNPSRIAVVYPDGRESSGRASYSTLTFRQFDEESDRYAHGLTRIGIKQGCRVLIMIPAGIEFLALSFALFKIGAVLILIDPGMGKKNLLHCIDEVEPQALISVPLGHLLKKLYRKPFKQVKYAVTHGRRWFWGGNTLKQIRENVWRKFTVGTLTRLDPAAIVFTTGSTGIPKGVPYCHGTLDSQIRSIQGCFSIEENEVGLPAFPPFALFCIAMGTTCVMPKMDPTRLAQVDPIEMLRLIESYHVTYSFGSPAFWNRVSRHCVEHRIRIPSIKKIIMAGAPVSGIILGRLKEILGEDAESHTPYGATEALPLTSITGSEVLTETVQYSNQGAGICVGRPIHGITLKVIGISDEVIAEWNESLVLPQGQVGEIVVKGPVVTTEYYQREYQTALSKIADGGSVWHRMGDVGYLDEKGRLWFCGRKSHRVITANKTLFTVQCESVFNQHENVFRSALVGIGPRKSQRPVIIIEPKSYKMTSHAEAAKKFTQELLDLGNRNELTREIKDVLFYSDFPVDFRHNSKILREQLALWAEEKIK